MVLQTFDTNPKEVFFDWYEYLKVTEYKVPQNASEKYVLMFGRTGAGKSLLGNVLLNVNAFDVSDSTVSCTKKTTELRSFGRKLVLYDTKGLLDTDDMKKTLAMNQLEKEKFIAGKCLWNMRKLEYYIIFVMIFLCFFSASKTGKKILLVKKIL